MRHSLSVQQEHRSLKVFVITQYSILSFFSLRYQYIFHSAKIYKKIKKIITQRYFKEKTISLQKIQLLIIDYHTL